MRKLSVEEIKTFASRPNVKRIAVENFLATVTNNKDQLSALANLSIDVKLYNWNRETVKAIEDGINLSFGNQFKPVCKLVGTDGNVFALAGKVGSALKRAGLGEKAEEFYKRLPEFKSYDEALNLMTEYVDVR